MFKLGRALTRYLWNGTCITSPHGMRVVISSSQTRFATAWQPEGAQSHISLHSMHGTEV
jgi:hypothetical protein